MPMDPFQLDAVIEDVIGGMPHPDAPSVPIREYDSHERVAAMMNNPKEPEPGDVAQAYHLLKQLDMSPAEWEHAWKLARPVANRMLDRDPDPQELAMFKGAHPGDVHDYYSSHPYPDHEEVKAGDVVRYMHAATPIAHTLAGRKPVLNEVAQFAAAGYDTEDIHRYYRDAGKEE